MLQCNPDLTRAGEGTGNTCGGVLAASNPEIFIESQH